MTTTLPKAIQAQIAAADELSRQLGQPPEAAAPEVVVPEDPVEPPEAEVAAPEVPASEPVEVKPTPAEAEWKQRYGTLQGKYNAEVPRLIERNRELEQSVQALNERIEKLATPKPPVEAAITDKDREAFGDDLIELMQRVFRDQAAQLPAVDVTPVLERVTRVEQKQATSAEQQFWQTLNSTIPDLEQINADQRWLDWLGQTPDVLSEETRQDILDRAVLRMDARKVGMIFNQWKAQFAPGKLEHSNQAAQELRSQVTPAKTKAAPGAAAAERVWTKAEYESAFDPRASKALAPEVAGRLQSEADRAAQEGRVRWG